ncbi:hypothetical protein F2P81_002484 [Scophthalmus maximus]|uniref:Uncharacterized protein n=1 Tax=Scophthalmus maximus TaxID=52904 RepID=A0A6A4TL43_SCOMX|nr:hypothetical protein F2P81_002484 [Scophthalmus maximus]
MTCLDERGKGRDSHGELWNGYYTESYISEELASRKTTKLLLILSIIRAHLFLVGLCNLSACGIVDLQYDGVCRPADDNNSMPGALIKHQRHVRQSSREVDLLTTVELLHVFANTWAYELAQRGPHSARKLVSFSLRMNLAALSMQMRAALVGFAEKYMDGFDLDRVYYAYPWIIAASSPQRCSHGRKRAANRHSFARHRITKLRYTGVYSGGGRKGLAQVKTSIPRNKLKSVSLHQRIGKHQTGSFYHQ